MNEPIDAAGEPGRYRVVLPPDLPVKPDNNLTLVVHARRDGGSPMVLREELPLAQPVYLAHLATDRPVYHPGDTVFFRSLTLERFISSSVLQTPFYQPDSWSVFARHGAVAPAIVVRVMA